MPGRICNGKSKILGISKFKTDAPLKIVSDQLVPRLEGMVTNLVDASDLLPEA